MRDLARRFDLPNRERKDSQGICFLGKIPYDGFIAGTLGGAFLLGLLLLAWLGLGLTNHLTTLFLLPPAGLLLLRALWPRLRRARPTSRRARARSRHATSSQSSGGRRSTGHASGHRNRRASSVARSV